MATINEDTYDRQGNLINTRVVGVETTEQVNDRDLRQKALTALDANATYLALVNPTNAQNLVQIQRLTRECSGLIRLLLGRLEDTAGT